MELLHQEVIVSVAFCRRSGYGFCVWCEADMIRKAFFLLGVNCEYNLSAIEAFFVLVEEARSPADLKQLDIIVLCRCSKLAHGCEVKIICAAIQIGVIGQVLVFENPVVALI